MTKTQANEPGFVLVPREPTEAMWSGLARDIVMWTRFGGRPTGATLHAHLRHLGRSTPDWLFGLISDDDMVPPKGVVAFAIYRAMLAAAPLVPSPAYGGVKEALEPFAKEAANYDFGDGSGPDTQGSPDSMDLYGMMTDITVGDLRRARTAYDAISPVAVEEADAKAGEPIARELSEMEREARWDMDHAKLKGDHIEARCKSHVIAALGELRLRANINPPSTPSPQIGNAGAGPVGEAVAFEFEWAPFEIEQWERGVSLRDPLVHGSVRRYRNVRPLYARTVEEPGEVERLTRERDEARKRLAEVNLLFDAGVAGAERVETALAETHRHLEKELRRAGFALDEALSVIDAEADPVTYARIQAAAGRVRAALTGDAQEAGR